MKNEARNAREDEERAIESKAFIARAAAPPPSSWALWFSSLRLASF